MVVEITDLNADSDCSDSRIGYPEFESNHQVDG